MAKVIKIFKTVRENWKKSILAIVITGYGVKFVNRKYEEDLLRREYCKEAKKYGDVKINIGERPRKITVFLNPAASSGKASKLFEKNAAPLLHLAGLEVNLIKTEYEGQVKKFMEVMEKNETDGIIAAGGGGTLLEVSGSTTGVVMISGAPEDGEHIAFQSFNTAIIFNSPQMKNDQTFSSVCHPCCSWC